MRDLRPAAALVVPGKYIPLDVTNGVYAAMYYADPLRPFPSLNPPSILPGLVATASMQLTSSNLILTSGLQ